MSFHQCAPAGGILHDAQHAAVGGPFPVIGTSSHHIDVERRLTDEEVALARSVFEESLNLVVVRVAMAPRMSASTPGNVIRLQPIGAESAASTLLRELTRVWQFQTRGAGYAASYEPAYELSASQLPCIRSIAHLTPQHLARIVELYFASTLRRSEHQARGEFQDLDRLIEQVRRARPISSEYTHLTAQLA